MQPVDALWGFVGVPWLVVIYGGLWVTGQTLGYAWVIGGGLYLAVQEYGREARKQNWGNMEVLTREAILAKKELRRETVEVPEWGGQVIVRELMGDEADIFEASLAASRNTAAQNDDETAAMSRHFRAKIIALSCIDESGNRLFTDEDVLELGKLGRAPLDRVSTVAMKLSGYTLPEQAATKKNSQTVENSSTALH